MALLKKDVSLKQCSHYKIGGNASYFLEVNSLEDLKSGLEEYYSEFSDSSKRSPIFILGSGTNILIDDRGFDGLVIRDMMSKIEADGEIIRAFGGALFEDLLKKSVEHSLSGLEWAGGLPGTVGGAVRGNAGAFGGETKDRIIAVKSFNLESFEETLRGSEDCEFSYRMSYFKKNPSEMIITADFKLDLGNSTDIQKGIDERANYRRERHPLEFPNIGSTFKNIPLDEVPEVVQKEFSACIKDDPFPIMPAAKLLAVSGLKGRTVGGAKISEKHPNFIVNFDNAKSSDVRELISIAKSTILDNYGISLEEEIYYL